MCVCVFANVIFGSKVKKVPFQYSGTKSCNQTAAEVLTYSVIGTQGLIHKRNMFADLICIVDVDVDFPQ